MLRAASHAGGEGMITFRIFKIQNLGFTHAELFKFSERQVNPATFGVGADVA